MSSMIERCARAMAAVNISDWNESELMGFTKEAWIDRYWADWEDEARAAIEAMMEPSEEMVKAGKPYAGVAASSAKRTYQAMLTAALADAPGEG